METHAAESCPSTDAAEGAGDRVRVERLRSVERRREYETVLLERDAGVSVFEYHELMQRAAEELRARFDFGALNRRVHWIGAPDEPPPAPDRLADAPLDQTRLVALGWNKMDAADVEAMASTGKEPVSGLGWDGPLAALSSQRKNLSDYFHERVAVVTNPAA